MLQIGNKSEEVDIQEEKGGAKSVGMDIESWYTKVVGKTYNRVLKAGYEMDESLSKNSRIM